MKKEFVSSGICVKAYTTIQRAEKDVAAMLGEDAPTQERQSVRQQLLEVSKQQEQRQRKPKEREQER